MSEMSLENSLLGFCTLHDVRFYQDHGVVIRNDEDFIRNSERVALLSGGGSGHEPGHNGFVGHGMLSASVCGNVFTSPSATSCLAAILLACGGNKDREILVIINNYTGDRMNFGLAVEMARNIHNYRNVKLLIVDDDCSIDNPRHSTGRRGLAGISLINKIAGALAQKGSLLSEIHDLCSGLLSNRSIRTIGFSFHHDKSNELANIEIGYGIHGEPGSMKIEKERNFKPIIRQLMEKLRLNDVKADVVILFNNLGGCSEFIFYQFVREFIELVSGLSIRIVKVYAGRFLTSLRKEALSVTVMEVADSALLDYLDMPVDVPAKHLFNDALKIRQPTVSEFSIPEIRLVESNDVFVSSEEKLLTFNAIAEACNAAIGIKDYLNIMDSELGDGDTGSTVARGASSLMEELHSGKLNVNNPHHLLLQISSSLMDSMGGTSGAIFSIFFQCASIAFADKNHHSIEHWMRGIYMGIEGIKQHGNAQTCDRTLIDSLEPGLLSLKEEFTTSKDSKKALRAFAKGCFNGAEATKTMSPKSGRASYSNTQSDDEVGFTSAYQDSGAYAVAIIAIAICSVLIGE